MGGLVTRACLSFPDCRNKVAAVYTLGTPHAGLNAGLITKVVVTLAELYLQSHNITLPLNKGAAALQPALYEMNADNMLLFNAWPGNYNQPGIQYTFIGGDYSPNYLWGLGWTLRLTEGPHDGVVGRNSAIGWAYPLNQPLPIDWTRGIPTRRYWTDEVHAGISLLGGHSYQTSRNGSVSHAFTCIAHELGLSNYSSARPSHCRVASTEAFAASESLLTLNQTTASFQKLLAPNEVASFPLYVDTQDAALFFVAWTEGEAEVTLQRPDGQVIDPAYALANSSLVTYERVPGSSDFPPSVSYLFNTTLPGEWHIIVHATNVPESGSGFVGFVAEESTRRLDIVQDKTIYHPGDSAVFSARVVNALGGIEGASIVATVSRPDGITETVSFTTIGNGNYQATYPIPDIGGHFILKVVASGQDGDAFFTRQAESIWAVAPSTAIFTDNVSDFGLDEDGDNLYEALIVDVEVNVTRPSTYTLSAKLAKQGESIATTTVYKVVETPGVHTFRLSFDEAHIWSMQQDGPFVISEATLVDVGIGGIPVDSVDVLHTTAHYSFNDFRPIIAPSTVSLVGPTNVEIGRDYTFVATVSPKDTTPPLQYTWEASGFPPIMHSAGLSDTATFNWDVSGSGILTVTVQNDRGSVVATQYETIYIEKGTYQEDSPALTLVGNWQKHTEREANSGGYITNDKFGDTVSLTFSGDSIVLLQKKDPKGGFVSVLIDDEYYGTLWFYAPEERWQVPTIFEGLGSGIHTITMQIGQDHPDGWPHTSVFIDAFVLPSSYSPTKPQTQALERVNYYRTIAGLPLAQSVQPIHMGAQSHAEFLANNRKDDPRLDGLGAHNEFADLPGFTGTLPGERSGYFGYSYFTQEGIHFIGDPVQSVDEWMATVYHRFPTMCYSCTDLGYGMVRDDRGRFDVLNMGYRTNPVLDGRVIYTYPANGQKDVPILWDGGEIPDPLPNKPRPLGYPVSLHIQQPSFFWDMWQLTKAELRVQGGQLVPSYVLEQQNDLNSLLSPDVVFIVPHQPLLHNTNYEAHVSGIDSTGLPFEHTWSFTTRKASPDLIALPPWLFINSSAPNAISHITVLVDNRGEVPVENVQVAFYLGDPQHGGTHIGETQVIARLDAGASAPASIDWQPPHLGRQTITVYVDPSDMITESNEDNNVIVAELEFPMVAQVQLMVSVVGDGEGAVTSEPVGIDCASTCQSNFAFGTQVTLTATADAGFAFVGWEGDCIDTAPCVLVLDAPKTVAARIVPGSGDEDNAVYLPVLSTDR